MNNLYNFYQNKNKNKDFPTETMFPNRSFKEDAKNYLPSPDLIEAVNVAIMLQKPLLLTGKPGTGKTALAYHLANRFGLGEVLDVPMRTDSTASDLLYRYDSLAHFQWVNIQKQLLSADDVEDKFIRYQGLGQAILDSAGQNEEHKAQRRLVLIDEIDKAPRDLPNDLLRILEDMTFKVPELKTPSPEEEATKEGVTEEEAAKEGAAEEEAAKEGAAEEEGAAKEKKRIWEKKGDGSLKPLVIITSNSEKTLPEAFLRRCVFFHIEMPKGDALVNILLQKKALFPKTPEAELKELVALFEDLRADMQLKEPATHELILWAWWMQQHGFEAKDIRQFSGIEEEERRTRLLSGLSILAKETEDWKRLRTHVASEKYKPNDKA